MTYTNDTQIGEVTEVTGVATITHTDGSEEIVTLGTPIHQGDIVETEGLGAVNIGFIDDSSFAISQDAKISIDEFVFDPENETGDQDFSVMHGVFMYTSGLIGRENPDSVEIDTPVGSIGIRGTIIGGNINPTGESQITVVEGAIVVRNDAGEQLLTNQFETVTLLNRETAPSEVRTLNVQEVANDYGAIKDVNADLFSSFSDQMKQEGPSNNLEAEQPVDGAEEVKEEPNTDDLPVEEQVNSENLVPTLKSMDGHRDSLKRDLLEEREGNKPRTRNHKRLHEPNEEQDAQEIQIDTSTPLNDKTFNISGGSILENSDGSGSPIFVGQVTLGGVTNTTGTIYSLTSNPGNNFSIDATTGEVSFIGSNARDFETGHNYNLGITATRPNGKSVTRPVTIKLENYEEIDTAFEDTYSVTGDINGVINFNEVGAYATEITVDGKSAGDNYDVSDFTILGSTLGGFFELAEVGGEIVLQLKSNVKINDHGTTFKFQVDATEIATIHTKISPLHIDVSLNSNGQIITVNLAVGEITDVDGTTNVLISGGQDVVFGDEQDNTITLDDQNFKFIHGGDGHDMIKLDGAGGAGAIDIFDFTSTVNNITGPTSFSADLKSIEEIRFIDNMDELKLNIQDLKDLLRTSENGEFIIANGDDTTTDGSGHNNISFYNGATEVDIQAYGFTKSATTVDHNGETFHEYVHDNLGSVFIEANINGADNGGL